MTDRIHLFVPGNPFQFSIFSLASASGIGMSARPSFACSPISHTWRCSAAPLLRCRCRFATIGPLLALPGKVLTAQRADHRPADARNYMGGSTVTAVMTLIACPAMTVPCGFDQYGRSVCSLSGSPASRRRCYRWPALFEQLLGLDPLLPIDPERAWFRRRPRRWRPTHGSETLCRSKVPGTPGAREAPRR
jgi:hypothetical protein